MKLNFFVRKANLSNVSRSGNGGGGGGGGDATWGNIGGNINNQTDLNNEFVKKSTFLNTIFPTGTVLLTYNKVSPATYIGGEWELIEEGYYPVATVQNTIEARLLNAELPNIKGDFASRGLTDGDFVNHGAFGVRNVVTRTSQSYGTNQSQSFAFDASKGQVNADGTTFVEQENSVYKDGGKVQPKSILLYMWRRVDNGTLTYNFVNISFSENDFITDPSTGQISLRNAIYYYTPNEIPKADNTGKLISSGININDIVLKTRKVAGYDLEDDITAQEIQDAIKNITATLTNKTINADNNTITNLETDNFKDTALAKSTDNVRNYEDSVDTKLVAEKFLQKTLRNIATPTENNYAVNKKYVDDEIQKVVERTFTFKGFISLTAPTGTIKVGSFWYESATLPTTFPINVKTYDGTNWSSTTSEYNPSQFDYFVNDNDNHDYYWNGNSWRIFDIEVLVDNITIQRNNEGKLEIKDGGITFAKFDSDLTKQSLANDYYFKFSDGTNTYYTKTIVDGNNIDVYTITITNNKITAITLQETKGTLANGVLTFSSVEYAHNIFGDGFYVVGDDEILITISALQDVLEKAGKVNDVKVAGISQVKNKEANIQTIDNVENDFYYAFKNGSTYYYTKSKATGSTAYYQFTYTDNVLTKIENKGNVTVELDANRVPQITISSTIYTLDTTKNDYYIIDPKQKLPSMENETRDFTQDELNRIFENFYVNPNPVKRYTGNDAFVYRTSASAGLTISGDYNSSTAPRTLLVQGKMAHLSFTLKGSAVANSANWTYLGAVPEGLRPKYGLTVLAMCYNGTENDSCGGYITTDGTVVVWCNPKAATNNYQIRVAVSYLLQD